MGPRFANNQQGDCGFLSTSPPNQQIGRSRYLASKQAGQVRANQQEGCGFQSTSQNPPKKQIDHSRYLASSLSRQQAKCGSINKPDCGFLSTIPSQKQIVHSRNLASSRQQAKCGTINKVTVASSPHPQHSSKRKKLAAQDTW